MATTKRVAKKAAKKAVPKVKEVKQIILTQEQWDELSNIRFTLTALGYDLENTFSDDDKNTKQIAFDIAKVYKDLLEQQSKLDKIVDDTDPDPAVDYSWDEFEGDDNDN
jgi:hypothetical protein